MKLHRKSEPLVASTLTLSLTFEEDLPKPGLYAPLRRLQQWTEAQACTKPFVLTSSWKALPVDGRCRAHMP